MKQHRAVLWSIAITGLLLSSCLLTYKGDLDLAEEDFGLLMAIATFPTCMILSPVTFAYASFIKAGVLSVPSGSSVWTLSANAVVGATVMYLQWGVLIPRLVRWLKLHGPADPFVEEKRSHDGDKR